MTKSGRDSRSRKTKDSNSRNDESSAFDQHYDSYARSFRTLVKETEPQIDALVASVKEDAEAFHAFRRIRSEMVKAVEVYHRFRYKNAREKLGDANRAVEEKVAKIQELETSNPDRKKGAVEFMNAVKIFMRERKSPSEMAHALYFTSHIYDSYSTVLREKNWTSIKDLKTAFDRCKRNFPKKSDRVRYADIEAASKAVQEMQGIKDDASEVQQTQKKTYSEARRGITHYMWEMKIHSDSLAARNARH